MENPLRVKLAWIDFEFKEAPEESTYLGISHSVAMTMIMLLLLLETS
jgi:hypothetical protein